MDFIVEYFEISITFFLYYILFKFNQFIILCLKQPTTEPTTYYWTQKVASLYSWGYIVYSKCNSLGILTILSWSWDCDSCNSMRSWCLHYSYKQNRGINQNWFNYTKKKFSNKWSVFFTCILKLWMKQIIWTFESLTHKFTLPQEFQVGPEDVSLVVRNQLHKLGVS